MYYKNKFLMACGSVLLIATVIGCLFPANALEFKTRSVIVIDDQKPVVTGDGSIVWVEAK